MTKSTCPHIKEKLILEEMASPVFNTAIDGIRAKIEEIAAKSEQILILNLSAVIREIIAPKSNIPIDKK